MLLAGKVVIVTGVGPGLGRELCHVCAREGAAVVAAARDAERVESVARELRRGGARALAVPTDVGVEAQARRLVDAAVREFGGVDALVNSAFSVGELAVFPDVDLAAWRNALEVNLFGALALSRAVVAPMERRGGGAIVNVNTMSSRHVMLAQGAYGVSKAALTAATRQLAVELGPKGIRVNTVILGPMRGPNLDSAMANWAARRGVALEDVEAEVARNMALQRIPEDAECAAAIALLLSDHARVITGAEITANAGAFLEARVGNAPPGSSGAPG